MRKKRALYNIITNLILQFITVIYGFVVPKMVISHFGSNVNGLISSISQFLAYISLLESGFGPVVKSILYKPIAKKDNKTIASILKSSELFFKGIAYIFLIYIFILCIIYPLLVNKEFGHLYTVSLILIIGISTFAEYFFGMTYRLFLQASQKTYIISIIQIFTYIFSLVIIIVLVKMNASIQLIKLIAGVIFILRPLAQNYYVKKRYCINLKDVKDIYNIKQKWDGLAQHIAAVIHQNTDITLLTIFCAISEVSVYAVYFMIVKAIRQIMQALRNGIDASFGDMLANEEYVNLNKKFNLYEILYFSICTVIFSCTMILITPFISVYTKNINDANYIRYIFGFLIVIAEYICSIREIYNDLIKSAGHFKETQIGAWFECIINLIISLLLIKKYGLIGVTIGTIVAMLIRALEFIYHVNKYILKRKISETLKKILLLIMETIFIVFLFRKMSFNIFNSYYNWTINALIVGILSCIIVAVINVFVYKNDLKKIYLLKKN